MRFARFFAGEKRHQIHAIEWKFLNFWNPHAGELPTTSMNRTFLRDEIDQMLGGGTVSTNGLQRLLLQPALAEIGNRDRFKTQRGRDAHFQLGMDFRLYRSQQVRARIRRPSGCSLRVAWGRTGA
jgi:hypothetical protein